MAKVQRIAVARKQGQRRIELPDQVEVSLARLAGRAKQGLLAFAVSVGLEVFATEFCLPQADALLATRLVPCPRHAVCLLDALAVVAVIVVVMHVPVGRRIFRV